MSLLQLILKQMRQRALGTSLTLLSVLLGVALAVSILLMRSAGAALFGQTDYGFDVMVGVGKGSPLQLTLNTVYHLDVSPGNIPYWKYEVLNSQDRPPRGSKEFNYNSHVRSAVPIAVGDTYKGRPIVGSPPKMFVSLSGLRDRVDALRTKQAALRNDVAAARGDAGNWRDDFAARQAAVKADLQALREEVRRVARETTPLIEPADPTVEPSADDKKWRYGKPAGPRLDAALADSDAAAAALGAKDAAAAGARQDAVGKALDAVFKAAGAENGPLEYRPGKTYELDKGRVFHAWKFEAVVGSEVADRLGVGLYNDKLVPYDPKLSKEENDRLLDAANEKQGGAFHATHGNPGPNDKPDVHPELWRVVGVMKPTHTAADRCLYIPLISFYTIAEHDEGQKAHSQIRQGESTAVAKGPDEDEPKYKLVPGDELSPDLPHDPQYINLDAPKKEWEVSAVLVKSRGGVTGDDLIYFVKNGGLADVQAVNPARVMREFFDTFFGASTTILLIMALLVSVVAAIGILVSIYNSVAARSQEIAILRALGATRGRILVLFCAEAGLIGLVGGVMGLVFGHLLGGVASGMMSVAIGQGFNWLAVGAWELGYLVIVVLISVVAGLVPAMKAYLTPVATNLVAA